MGIKYKVDESFFDKWSHGMAYLLGFLFADGSLEYSPKIRGKYLRATSIDRHIIVALKEKIKSGHPIVKLKPTTANGKPRYFLRIGSHKLYDSLAELGLTPRKSLTMQFPSIPKKYLGDFVRGYFDGDGHVRIHKARGSKDQLLIKRLRIVFTSGSKQFLEDLSIELVNNFGIKQANIVRGDRSWKLAYSTADSILLFQSMYNNLEPQLYFERKFLVFKEYFQLKPEKVDSRTLKILNKMI